jgi:hypothetical protein
MRHDLLGRAESLKQPLAMQKLLANLASAVPGPRLSSDRDAL